MRYHIITYGCQMNKSDSERIATALESKGYRTTSCKKGADLIVVNACTVRQSAVDRVYGQTQFFDKLKKKGKKIKTVLTGCILPKDRKKLANHFDLILDIKDLPKLPQKLANLSFRNLNKSNSDPDPKSRETQIGTSPKRPSSFNKKGCPEGDSARAKRVPIWSNPNLSTKNYLHIQPKYSNKISVYVPIMTGCNNFCSYCVVPYTRGREVSRPSEEIIREIRDLIKRDYKEIILLGQNVNSYINPSRIKTNKNTNDFAQLLEEINDIPGKFWVFFTSSHPKDFSQELIDVIAKGEKICKYIHLPAQSGDNKILKKMNRGYTTKYFRELIRDIRNRIPGVSVSTDIIVGFPGETEKQFEGTLGLLKEVKFDMAYIARYSPREGTQSARLKDNISQEEKKRRENVLTDVLKKTALENNKELVGKEMEVLVKGVKNICVHSSSNSCKLVYYGKTRGFKDILITNRYKSNTNKHELVGEFIKIKVTEATPWGLKGRRIS